MENCLNRRDFLKALGAGSSFLALPGCIDCKDQTSREQENPPPNIIYIMADDMGYGDLGCQNKDSKIPTPNMDALAAQGMRFTDAHTGSAVCTPTRYGLLTGRYAWRSRLKKSVLWGYSPALIEPDRVNVASFLEKQGYVTGCVGKWHLGLDWGLLDNITPSDRADEKGKNIDYSKPITNGPIDLGFDYFYGIPASLDMIPYVYIENRKVVAPPIERIKGTTGRRFYRGGPCAPGFKHKDTLSHLTGKAVDFIDRNAGKSKEKPFFLYLPLTAPHTPVLPADFVKGKSKAGEYGDFVFEVDFTVGQVMKALNRHGVCENTLIIFTSDNGSTELPMKEYDHRPNAELRGRKSDAWDGGHRVPFIARWPGRIEAGSICEETICHTDLLATCAQIIGADLPDNAGEDSYGILPALLQQPYNKPLRAPVIHHSINGLFAIRKGKWKLIEGKGSGGWTSGGKNDPAKGQLYNMAEDLKETNNLYLKRPDIVSELTAHLNQIRRSK